MLKCVKDGGTTGWKKPAPLNHGWEDYCPPSQILILDFKTARIKLELYLNLTVFQVLFGGGGVGSKLHS